MKWNNRILVLLAIASALAGIPGGTCMVCADESDAVGRSSLWTDKGPHRSSPVRSVVAGILGCPTDDSKSGRISGMPLHGSAGYGSLSPQTAFIESDPLLSAVTAATARRAGGALVAGILGCPPDHFSRRQASATRKSGSAKWGSVFQPSAFTEGKPSSPPGMAATARRTGGILLAEVLGCPPEHFMRASDPAFISDDLALASQFPFDPAESDTPMPQGDAQWEAIGQPWYNTPAAYPYGRQSAVRFGWWGAETKGDLTTVGEYQDFRSSRFLDLDQLSSDGLRTVNLFATGTDREGAHAGLYFYGPMLTADVEYQQYLRRLNHDPLSNFSAPGSGEVLVAEDLNAGEDYAIRVQNLKTHIKGRFSKNLKYRVNFWLLRKFGDRQAIGSQHCAGGNMFGSNDDATCHVLSQTQQIDWLTMKVEPVIEGRWGPVTVEYSRPMRSFGQNDQIVTRQYGDFNLYDFAGQHPYAFVPENVKQTDRLKVGVDLTERTRLYSKLHTSNTHNEFRQTDRRVNGADLRLTNHPSDRLTLTAYTWMNRQRNEFPPFFVDPEGQAMSPTYVSGGGTTQPQFSSIIPRYGLRHPIDYSRYTAGAEATWKPEWWTELAKGLSFSTGCEYGATDREYADYVIEESAIVVSQQNTHYISYFTSANVRWSPKFKTFLRYKGRTTSDPLYGVDLSSGTTNTSLPEQDNLVEIGGTWVPASNFVANVNAGIRRRSNRSDIAQFEEDSYPFTVTFYYAPTYSLTLNAGYGGYSTWIDQDVYFPSDDPALEQWDRRRWNYGGRSQVLSLGAGYALSPRVTLTEGIEFVWARDAVDPFQPWPDLPEYFDVAVNKTRYNAGVDVWVREGITAYFRYLFQDYEDKSVDYNSGTAYMFLMGASAIY